MRGTRSRLQNLTSTDRSPCEHPIHETTLRLPLAHSTPPLDHPTRTALCLGALSVLATGVDHIQQYYSDDYSTVPTIGTLFFLNFVSAVIVAVGLIAPLGRVAGRYADAIRALFAVGGIAIAVLSLAALFVSESSGLFGFVEHGYRMAIAVAIVVEVAATVFLVIFLAANGTGLQAIRSRSR